MTPQPDTILAGHDGSAVLTTGEAIVKGTLECSSHVSTLILSRAEGNLGLAQRLGTPAITALLAEHRLALHRTDDAARAVRLGRWAAGRGGLHVVLATGPLAVAQALGTLEAALPEPAGVAIVVEATLAQRQAVLDAGLPVLEPASAGAARDAVEQALRLSRAAGRAVLIAVTPTLLRSGGSVTLRPNHGHDTPRREGSRQRHLRWERTETPLRLARRLELNTFRELPSPGETAPLGVITIGQADELLRQTIREAGTPTLCPVLHLGLSTPLDDAATSRMLERCREVVVIEPGAAAVANELRAVADERRREDRTVATVTQVHTPETVADLRRALSPWMTIDGPATDAITLPGAPRADRPAIGDAAMRRAVRNAACTAIDVWSTEQGTTRVEVDGTCVGPEHGTLLCVETWTSAGFHAGGEAAVVQSLQGEATWVHLVSAGAPPQGTAVERLAAAFVPPEVDTQPFIQRIAFDEPEAMQRSLVEALERGGCNILVCSDVDVRWDAEARAARALDADRTGFRPIQRVVQRVERFCNPFLLQVAGWDEDTLDPQRHHSVRVERLDGPWRPRLAFRLRPQHEIIEVTRTQAPVVSISGPPLPQPEPQHASSPIWRAHLAGLRGRSPGVAARVLAAAGNAMGYTVHWRCDPSPSGPGRRAWAQIQFEQPPAPGTAGIGPRQTDLLLAVNAAGLLDAADRRGLCDPSRTNVAVSTADDDPVTVWVRQYWGNERLVQADVEETCRRRFHTDRLADMVLLGVAFQNGWIPVSLDALHAAMRRTQDRGLARLDEAFAFGRRCALQPALLAPDRVSTPVDSPVRRARRWRLLGRWAARRRDDRLGDLLDRTLSGLPGLAETADGRAMRGLLVDGLAAASIWGGVDFAQRLADDVLALYQVDRAETGRALTRAAIGPLVSTAVFLEPVYIARMAVARSHRGALRKALDVRPQRGDQMEVRYVTRLEVVAGAHRIRVDVRTSEWLAWAGVFIGRLVPARWRGSPHKRALRDAVRSLMRRATSESTDQYDHWQAVLEALRKHQNDGTLGDMEAAQVAALHVNPAAPHA